VQIGSALASTLGQLVHMSESRMRVIVACGAAGGIAATFNAPLTGLFFGFEIVLREFSLDALVATSLAAVTGDVISRAIFGSAPFFSMIPHGLSVTNDVTYLLVAVLAVLAGLIGIGFKTFLYWLEDFVDTLFGSAVGPAALYAVVAMGGVFAAAAQAPLTAIASVAEMTANFGLTLPIMLTCGIAAAVSKSISYGSIYTTKLLRRAIDIERPKTTHQLSLRWAGSRDSPQIRSPEFPTLARA
jgi:H+/Cl- antiporter ClcA